MSIGEIHEGTKLKVLSGWDEGSIAHILGVCEHHLTVNIGGMVRYWLWGGMPRVEVL